MFEHLAIEMAGDAHNGLIAGFASASRVIAQCLRSCKTLRPACS
jgi:hypothetical protein